jgi:HEAT repeat protein
MTADQVSTPPKPLRTWRPMIFWTAGILLALGLAWFVGAVVTPYLQVRAALARARGSKYANIGNELTAMGSQEDAARRLSFYLNLPHWMADDKLTALAFLRQCGPSATPPLVRLLNERSFPNRAEVAWCLGQMGDEAGLAVPSLVAALGDESEGLRFESARSLGLVGAAAKEATSSLERAFHDKSERVRRAAAEALQKIRGEAPH